MELVCDAERWRDEYQQNVFAEASQRSADDCEDNPNS